MSKSVNKVILLGNLTRDPEVSYTASGTAMAKLGIATTERFKNKQGEWEERPEFHNVVLWQKLAEIAGEYMKKGKQVYIEGRLQTRSYEKDGVKKYATDIVGQELILLSLPDNKGRGEKETSAKAEDEEITF